MNNKDSDKYRSLYENKLMLAPMVRISCLPMRLLALDYGADVVFCEEIIDHKMLQCHPVKNDLLDTMDFVWSDGSVIFRTCDREKDKVIFQIGTADSGRALKVAKMVEDHVASIDLNMGCPKEFSIKGGMGAALMGQPEKFTEILSNLVKNIKKPISCKTRIKSNLRETLEMMKRIESTGVSCVTVHGRTRDERPNDANHDDVIGHVTRSLGIPVVANGGSSNINSFEDVQKFKISTGCSSVMIGRSAMWNPSIFSRDGQMDDVDTVIRKFLRYATRYDSYIASVKYCIQQFLHEDLDSEKGKLLLNSNSVKEICSIWDMADEYDKIMDDLNVRKENLQKRLDEKPYEVELDEEDGCQVYVMPFKHNKRDFDKNSPKMALHAWAVQHKLLPPVYENLVHLTDKTYKTNVKFNSLKFASTLWDKSKRFSEQSAASVCIMFMNNPTFFHDVFRVNLPKSTAEYFMNVVPPKIPYSSRSIHYNGNNNNNNNNNGNGRDVNSRGTTVIDNCDVIVSNNNNNNNNNDNNNNNNDNNNNDNNNNNNDNNFMEKSLEVAERDVHINKRIRTKS